MRKLARMWLVAVLIPLGISQAGAQSVAVTGAAARSAKVGRVPGFVGSARLSRPLTPLSQSFGLPGLTPTLSLAPMLSAPVVSPDIDLSAAWKSVPGSMPAPIKLDGKAALGKSRLPAPPGIAEAVAVKTSQGSVSKAESVLEVLRDAARGIKTHLGLGETSTRLGGLFDNAGNGRSLSNRQDLRNPDWPEDKRIDKAFKKLAQSPIGTDLYNYVYENYGDKMSLMIDEDPSAAYDARVVWASKGPVIQLTEKLVDNGSPEIIASYIARELTEVYLKDFPASAERNYMAFSNMVRTFAELTDSGKSRRDYWWDSSKDQWTGEAYAMERYFGSWKEAVSEFERLGRPIRNSAFFTFLKEWDDSNNDADSKLSLRQLYSQGKISYRTFREMNEYFNGFVGTETSWFTETGRW